MSDKMSLPRDPRLDHGWLEDILKLYSIGFGGVTSDEAAAWEQGRDARLARFEANHSDTRPRKKQRHSPLKKDLPLPNEVVQFVAEDASLILAGDAAILWTSSPVVQIPHFGPLSSMHEVGAWVQPLDLDLCVF